MKDRSVEPPLVRARSHVREFMADSLTPLGVYRRLREISPIRFLFESVSGGEQVSRYSFLGAGPWGIYRLFADRLELERERVVEIANGVPLEDFRKGVGRVAQEPGTLPFTGGFVGYLGYDFVRHLEHLSTRPTDVFDLPDAILARFDNVIVFDHAHQRVLAIANEIDGEVDRAAARAQLERLTDLLTRASRGSAVALPQVLSAAADRPEPVVSGARFEAAVRRAQDYIAAGDIFQVVLARRWCVQRDLQPLSLYRALRTINPSPYMVLLEMPEVALVGASPEMLVRKTGTLLETRPIAGTRPRSRDPESDRQLASELAADPKERAEHVMLVDLGRNDLGRIAAAGSVRIPTFMEVERYSHVMHLVSSVEAELVDGRNSMDALQACFPAGTVSGAPKIRAMQIVDELEPESRGPYAGAVGYLSYNGDVDTCITIRTLVLRSGEISMTAGAGIVADSDPATEVRETESKAAATLAAIDLAGSLTELEEGGSEPA